VRDAGRRAVSCERGSPMVTDPIEEQPCPGCGSANGVQRITGTAPEVDAGMCATCGMHWATTVINPALSLLGVFSTPQLRTAAFLAALRTEVTQRSAKRHTITVCFPVDQVVQFDAMATVDTSLWSCRICGRKGTARTTPQAISDAVAHLGSDHGGVTRDCAPRSPQRTHHDRHPRGGDAPDSAR
jgi:ribosomal protein L37AE/L43A